MNLKDKTVVITGATTGIGRETALAIGRMGARLALVARDPAKGSALQQELARAGNSNVTVYLADLSLMAQVMRVGREIAAAHPAIHVLVNNAGGIFTNRTETAEGMEMTFALNHLNYFLLTHLLLPSVKAAAQQDGEARIVNVASAVHALGKIDFDNLNMTSRYVGIRQYCNTKLMNILFTAELAKRLHGTGVTANSLHPGSVGSGFGGKDNGWFTWLFNLGKPFMITPAQGAQTSLFLAASDAVKGVSGKYFAKEKEKHPAAQAQDAAVAARLWQVSEQLCGIK
jgi:NAD(P)-dependent dehydrogenase (short-subunit alcohol dehydrogenase family)